MGTSGLGGCTALACGWGLHACMHGASGKQAASLPVSTGSWARERHALPYCSEEQEDPRSLLCAQRRKERQPQGRGGGSVCVEVGRTCSRAAHASTSSSRCSPCARPIVAPSNVVRPRGAGAGRGELRRISRGRPFRCSRRARAKARPGQRASPLLQLAQRCRTGGCASIISLAAGSTRARSRHGRVARSSPARGGTDGRSLVAVSEPKPQGDIITYTLYCK